MQNIRISIDLMKVKSARLVRFPNASGQPTDYVCIPVSECFVPKEQPKPYLMLSLIHCPNAKYGDFMVKPYVSAEDYQVMSKEEQFNLPILGKGSFMSQQPNKQLSAAAEVVAVTDIQTIPTPDPTAANGSAAGSSIAPFPAEGGTIPLPQPQTDFEVYTPEGYVDGFPSFEAAQHFTNGKEVSYFIIRERYGNTVINQWRWVTTDLSWQKY